MAIQLFLLLNTEARRQLSTEIAGKVELADLLSMPHSGNLLVIDGMKGLLTATAELRAKALSESKEGRNKESIAADLEEIRKSAGGEEGIELYISRISDMLPFETFEVLLDPKNSQLLADKEFLGQLTAKMAKQNAREAIVALQGKGLMAAELLEKSLWQWTLSAPEESLDWLRNNKQLSAAELDAGYNVVVNSNRTLKNFPSAWQAINFIGIPCSSARRKAACGQPSGIPFWKACLPIPREPSILSPMANRMSPNIGSKGRWKPGWNKTSITR